LRAYQYTLINATTGSLTLQYAPVEWNSDQCFWERSMTYFGIFRTFSTSELTFVKAGGSFLKEIFDREGTEAVCTYQVEALNVITYNYDIVYTGVVDFSTYKYTIGSSGTNVKVQIIDNDFVNTIKTRELLNVSLSKLTGVDNNTIDPFTTETKAINIPARTDTLSAQLNCEDTYITDHAIPLILDSEDEKSVVSVVDYTNRTGLTGSFFQPTFNTNLSTNIVITGHLTYSSGTNSITINQKRYDSTGALQDTTVVGTQSSPTGYPITVNISGNFPSNYCHAGDYVVLEILHSGVPVTCDLLVSCICSYIKLITPAAYVAIGYQYHEAFARIIKSIANGAFYSELLGRTDSCPNSYAANGYLSPGIVTNGLLIRGFLFTDLNVGLNICLKDLFNSLHSIYPLSLGIETIGGVQTVRIEELRHVFRTDIFLTIEDCTEITEEVATDLTFSEVDFGFAKSQQTAFNQAVGRYEFNASVKYGTKITTMQNTLTQLSPYRADGTGIFSALAKHSSIAKSENTEYDTDNFLINYIPGSSNIAKGDNYTSVGNTGNATNYYNLDYQPARNLKRWGSFLRGFLDKYISSVLSFISSDYNSTAYSQRIDETAIVSEGVDIPVSDLANPFFQNSYYEFQFKITDNIMAAMSGNTNGIPDYYSLVQFRNNSNEDYRYGWIMKLESRKPDEKGFGTMKLLRASDEVISGLILTDEAGNNITDESSNQITV
jgi:hypothetical protein